MMSASGPSSTFCPVSRTSAAIGRRICVAVAVRPRRAQRDLGGHRGGRAAGVGQRPTPRRDAATGVGHLQRRECPAARSARCSTRTEPALVAGHQVDLLRQRHLRAQQFRALRRGQLSVQPRPHDRGTHDRRVSPNRCRGSRSGDQRRCEQENPWCASPDRTHRCHPSSKPPTLSGSRQPNRTAAIQRQHQRPDHLPRFNVLTNPLHRSPVRQLESPRLTQDVPHG